MVERASGCIWEWETSPHPRGPVWAAAWGPDGMTKVSGARCSVDTGEQGECSPNVLAFYKPLRTQLWEWGLSN